MHKNLSKRDARVILQATAAAIQSGQVTTHPRHGGYELKDLVRRAKAHGKTAVINLRNLIRAVQMFCQNIARTSHSGFLLVSDRKQLLRYASP